MGGCAGRKMNRCADLDIEGSAQVDRWWRQPRRLVLLADREVRVLGESLGCEQAFLTNLQILAG